jgi:glycine hydroxymethyltransferase
VFPGTQGGPLEHVIAAKAVALKEAMDPSFKEYAQRILDDVRALADGLAERGYRVIAGGTDTHLFLADVTGTGLTGAEAEARCDAAGIVLNKNAIPFDRTRRRSPRASGPGVRRRHPGHGALRAQAVAGLIDRALTGDDDDRACRARRGHASS